MWGAFQSEGCCGGGVEASWNCWHLGGADVPVGGQRGGGDETLVSLLEAVYFEGYWAAMGSVRRVGSFEQFSY